jgi:CubicO group peptidase (beta-lactamase class C family)
MPSNNDNFSKLNQNLDLFNMFDFKMKLYMKLARAPSISACVIKNNTMVWSKGYGFYKSLPRKTPTENTIYMVASISKSITATALLQLYENDSYDFSLDDNVSKWLPFDIKNPNFPEVNITFRMLLAHHSSLLDHNHYNSMKYLFSHHNFSFIKEILTPGGDEYHSEYWADYPPGSKPQYSNLAFTVIGYLIERMTGQTLEDFCQKNIFRPLKMMNTTFIRDKINKKQLARPYFKIAGFFIPFPNSDLKFCDPAGGIYTTIEDLSHFLIAHMNNGTYNGISILNSSTVELMHTIQYPESGVGFRMQFGLGWLVYVNNDEIVYEGHAGDLTCFHARMFYKKTDNVGIIFFYNVCSYTGPFRMIISQRSVKNIINLLFQEGMEY